MELNTASDPRYAKLQPHIRGAHLEGHGYHLDEMNYAEDSDQELAPTVLREPEKVAIVQSLGRALLQIFLYLIPVGLTFAILQLSFREIYWRGVGSSGSGRYSRYSINQVLTMLQIVAKAHEVLVVISLSYIVLYHIRRQLISANGIPFGLLTSAYQVTLGCAPFSIGFWNTCKSFVVRRTLDLQAFGLISLVILATILGLTAGPASAIAAIPQLNWWIYQDLFTFYESPDRSVKDFQIYVPKQLFPTVLDGSSLPGPYCLESSLDVNSSCPFAGYGSLLSVFNATDPNTTDNLTLADSTGLDRRMLTQTSGAFDPSSIRNSSDVRSIGQTKTWTQNQVLANYLSLGWKSGKSGIPDGDPYIVEAKTQHGPSLNPFVNVTCVMQASTRFNLSFFNRPWGDAELYGSTGPDHNGEIDIRSIWNETILTKSNQTLVEWREFFRDTDDPKVAAFILGPSFRRGEPKNVTMCGVTAMYDTNEMWIMSDQTPAISSNFTTFGRQIDSNGRMEDKHFPKIDIRREWAESLNAATKNSSTVMADLIDQAMQKYRQGSTGTPVLTQSKAISMAVADGIARIGAEFKVNLGLVQFSGCSPGVSYDVGSNNITICRGDWCSQGWFFDKCNGPVILNGSRTDYLAYVYELNSGPVSNVTGNLLRSFPRPSDIDTSWTRVSFPVKRYGYGWSMKTAAVKVATAILIAHTIVILAHCLLLIVSGFSYSYVGSLGDLVALALNSHAPKSFHSTSVGIARGSTWVQRTAIREIGEKEFGTSRLAMVIGDDIRRGEVKGSIHRRPVVGRGYQ